jgi:hypothetical protein
VPWRRRSAPAAPWHARGHAPQGDACSAIVALNVPGIGSLQASMPDETLAGEAGGARGLPISPALLPVLALLSASGRPESCADIREGGGGEEEEEGRYLRIETRKRVQTNEAKSKRRRASPTGGIHNRYC